MPPARKAGLTSEAAQFKYEVQDRSNTKATASIERSSFKTEGKLADMDPAERDRLRKAIFSSITPTFVTQLATGMEEAPEAKRQRTGKAAPASETEASASEALSC